MTAELQQISRATTLAELNKLFGAPPVLSSESMEAYVEIGTRLLEELPSTEVLEKSFIREILDSTWEAMRYTRHKTLAIDRRFRKNLEFQATRRAKLEARNEAVSRGSDKSAEKAEKPLSKEELEMQLAFVGEDMVDDVQTILGQSVAECEHAGALEHSIEYQAQLDFLLNSALARRRDALDQYRRYDEIQSRRAHQILDGIMHATMEAELARQDASLVPHVGSP